MRRWLIAATLVLALPACSTDGARSLGYDLTEFDVSGPSTLENGRTTISVSNSGEFAHTLVIAEQDGQVLAATEMIQPGKSVAMELDLAPGSYQFSCRIVGQKPDGSIVDHFEEGMLRTVSVGS